MLVHGWPSVYRGDVFRRGWMVSQSLAGTDSGLAAHRFSIRNSVASPRLVRVRLMFDRSFVTIGFVHYDQQLSESQSCSLHQRRNPALVQLQRRRGRLVDCGCAGLHRLCIAKAGGPHVCVDRRSCAATLLWNLTARGHDQPIFQALSSIQAKATPMI